MEQQEKLIKIKKVDISLMLVDLDKKINFLNKRSNESTKVV